MYGCLSKIGNLVLWGAENLEICLTSLIDDPPITVQANDCKIVIFECDQNRMGKMGNSGFE